MKFLILIFIAFSFCFAKDILCLDTRLADPIDVYNYIFDTLHSHDVVIHFVSREGYINLEKMSLFWALMPGDTFSDSEKVCLIDYVKHGGKILFWAANYYLGHFWAVKDLIYDDRWKVDIDLTEIRPYHDAIFIKFPPFSNGLEGDTIFVQRPRHLELGNNAYPFIFPVNDSIHVLAAISYPFLQENNCKGFIVVYSGVHNFERPEIHETDSIIFFWAPQTVLTSCSAKGYEFTPCSVPEPYQISVTSIPPCANPGDTVRICGRNLWRGKTESLGGDIEIYIGATEMVPHDYDTLVIPIRYAPDSTWLEFIMPDLPPGTYPIRLGHKAITFYAGEITVPCPMHADIFPECADPGDVITISGENLIEPINITVGDSVVSSVSYSEDRSKVSFRCPWFPRGRYQVNLSWHDMFVASGTIEIPCPHRCERFPNPITPNFDDINDFAQFEFDGIFVKPARIHIFDIHGHGIRTIDVPAGLSAKQHARWDGMDDGGNPVPEGVYIYTIEVAGEVVCEGTVTVAR